MKYIKLFENFLNEDLDVPLIRNQEDVMIASLAKLKKEKKAKGLREYDSAYKVIAGEKTTGEYFLFKFPSNDLFVLLSDGMSNSSPFFILSNTFSLY